MQPLVLGCDFLAVVDPGVFFLEFFEASIRNYPAASLAGVEWMTLRADTDPNLLLRGTGCKIVPTGTGHFTFLIPGVYVFFHL